MPQPSRGATSSRHTHTHSLCSALHVPPGAFQPSHPPWPARVVPPCGSGRSNWFSPIKTVLKPLLAFPRSFHLPKLLESQGVGSGESCHPILRLPINALYHSLSPQMPRVAKDAFGLSSPRPPTCAGIWGGAEARGKDVAKDWGLNATLAYGFHPAPIL